MTATVVKAAVATKPKTIKKPTVKKPVVKKAGAKPVDLIATTVHEIESLTQPKALKMVPELEDSNSYNDFKLGGVLMAIQDNGWWEGADSFRQFLKDSFGIDPTKAYALIKTYNALVESNVPWDAVKGVRWTKLDIISPVLDEENVEEWVQRAAELSSIQLREYVKSYLKSQEEGGEEASEPPEAATQVSTLTYKVHDDQKETIKNAVEKSKDDNDTEFDAVGLEFIALQFLEGGLGKAKPQKAMKTQMKTAGFDKAVQTLADLFPEEYTALVAEAEGGEGVEVDVSEVMKGLGVEGTLEAFEGAFPDVNLTAEL